MLKRVLRWMGIALGALIVASTLWSVLASYLWSLLTKEPNAFPWATSWWLGTHWFLANWWCNVCLVLSAAFATIATGVLSFCIIAYAISLRRRNPSQIVYGKTDWADQKEMAKGGISTRHRPF